MTVDFFAGTAQSRAGTAQKGKVLRKDDKSSEEVELAGRLPGEGAHEEAVERPCATAEASRLPPVAVNCSALPQHRLGLDWVWGECFVQRN